MLSLPITDAPEQTKEILRALAEERNVDVDLTRWHALQVWIACRNSRVAIPFATAVAELIPPVAVRLRRDVRTVFNLIAAHALLHQASRESDAEGRVVATIDDYAVVRDLVGDFVSEGVAATVSQATRETVGVVAAHPGGGFAEDEDARANPSANRRITVDFSEDEGLSVSAIADALGIDVSAAHRRVTLAVKGGYLKNLETKPRRKGRYVLDNPLPEETVILPSVEDVVCTFAQFSGPQAQPTFLTRATPSKRTPA
jgi:hypothetical protein